MSLSLHQEVPMDLIDPSDIAVIMGKRGEGKSALAYRMGELAEDNWDSPVYVVGFPQEKTDLIPESWHTTDTLQAIPENAFVIVDEAYRLFHARRSQQSEAVEMSKLISLARHNQWTLLFISQESTDLDINIIREADMLCFKQPSFLQIRFERAKMRDLMEEAKDSFDNLPSSANSNMHVYAMTDEFRGMLTNELPSFWSEDLSTVFAGNVALDQPGMFAGPGQDLIGPPQFIFGDFDDDDIPNVDDERPFAPGKDDLFYQELSLAEDVLARVQEVSQEHREVFEDVHQKLGFDKGRVKQPVSILQKLIRRYMDELEDIIGITIFEADHAAVLERAEEIMDQYEVLDSDNYIENPKDGVYYAYHVTIIWPNVSVNGDEVEVEIQIKTKEEADLQADMHDAYKAGEDLTPFRERAKQLARKYAAPETTIDDGPPIPEEGETLNQDPNQSLDEFGCDIEPSSHLY